MIIRVQLPIFLLWVSIITCWWFYRKNFLPFQLDFGPLHPASDSVFNYGTNTVANALHRRPIYYTIVEANQFHKLRQLVGSLHGGRPVGSQKVPIIYVYGHSLAKREIDELCLWRNVVWQDLRQVLFPFAIFDLNGALDNSTTTISRLRFPSPTDGPHSIQKHLMSRLVQMHGHAIFMAIGYSAYEMESFLVLHELLDKEGCIHLTDGKNVTVIEGYKEGSPTFTKLKSICDPTVNSKFKSSTFLVESQFQDNMTSFDVTKFGIRRAPQAGDENFNFECHICIRDDAHHGWRFYVDTRRSNSTIITPSRKKVALAFPTTSRGTKTFWDLPFLSIFLPTIARSFSSNELEKVVLHFYIGYDEGDRFLDGSRDYLNRYATKISSTMTFLNVPFEVTFVRLGTSGAVTFIWNVLFAIAVKDGMDYFYQLNDDIRFDSRGWLQTMMNALGGESDDFNGANSDNYKDFNRHSTKANSSMTPNFYSVVGPRDPAFDCKIMTQTMVRSLSHWHRFGWYFPPDFRNWHCDTWISLVYGVENTKCFSRLPIWNGRYGARNYTPRYRPCRQVDFRSLVEYYRYRGVDEKV